MYADTQGNIHHVHSDGTDLTLVDVHNVSTVLYPTMDPHYQAMMSATALGGDLTGTVANGHINYVSTDPHYQAMVNSTGVGGDSTGTVANMINFKATDKFTINVSGGNTQNAAGPPLTLPGVQNGPFASIAWADVGAGPMAINMRSYGGLPANNIMQFIVANGSSGGSVAPLQLTGDGLTTMGGPAKVTGQLQLLQVNTGLLLAGVSGGVVPSVAWGDVGAGPMRISLNSVGGVPSSNLMRFDIAAGSAGTVVSPLTLDGANRLLAPGDSFFGAGNVSPSIVAGFPYLPYTGGTPTGVPTYAASSAMIPVIFGPSLRLYAYLAGAWHYVQFT